MSAANCVTVRERTGGIELSMRLRLRDGAEDEVEVKG